jgi:RNA polymerase sigma factor (sigma-70 family)
VRKLRASHFPGLVEEPLASRPGDIEHLHLVRTRPNRDETFAAAVEIASNGSTTFKRFARRYSLCAADAEDAYQRALEILLTKAPTTDRSELRAWLHTVIKHEALALRAQRERALCGIDRARAAPAPPDSVPALDEQASGRERMRQSAEALAHLKVAEIECLLLKALGYSYNEIAERTGFSWTKVNRSLTEGRRRFIERFSELGAGARCQEFEALLSVACDGESTTAEERRLRVHLRRCGSCRAALRDYRSTPSRVAELLPPGILLPVLHQGTWWSRIGDWMSATAGGRTGVLAWKVQQGAEALGAQKAAATTATAVVASTAVLAGGAAVQEQRPHHPARHHAANSLREVARAVPEQALPQPTPIVERDVSGPSAQDRPSVDESKPVDASEAVSAAEFVPEASAPRSAAATARPPATEPAEETPPASSGSATGAGAQEFGP